MDSVFDTEIKSVGDNCVTDAYLVEQRESEFEEPEISKVQVMAGVETYPESAGLFRGCNKRSDSGVGV